MITRQSAKTIADAYHERFTHYASSYGRYGQSSEFVYRVDAVYDFLYVSDFDGWILNAVKKISKYDKRGLLGFIMRLHTGESLAPATPDWDWNRRKTLGQRFLRDLAASLIRVRHNDPAFEPYGDTDKKAVDVMQRQLEIDGYLFRDGVLLVPEESVLDEQEEEGVLEALVASLGMHAPDTIRHHLKLSAEHYHAERWDDSISNSRKVLEAVLQQVASAHSSRSGATSLTEDALQRAVRVRDYLESAGLLDKKEKEAIASTYALLSDTGAHPHIAQQDQARLMRHLALTYSQFVLLRFQTVVAGS